MTVTVWIPMWLIYFGYVLAGLGILALAAFGVFALWAFKDFKWPG